MATAPRVLCPLSPCVPPCCCRGRQVAIRDPLSSEGISLVMVQQPRVLVAFGGYNGKYQNAVSLFRAPMGSAALLAGPLASAANAVEERKAAQVASAPAVAADQGVVAAAAPPNANGAAPAAAGGKAPAAPAPAQPAAAAGGGKVSAAPSADLSAAASSVALVSELRQQAAELKAQLEGARREAESAIRESAAAKEGAAHELALLRKQLATAQGSLAEANKVRGGQSAQDACA